MAKLAYKLFRVQKNAPGKLFPLFVDAQNETHIGIWLNAKEGEKTDNGKVKSRLGPLCFRPGWHLSDIPLAIHIGVKDESGNITKMNAQHVWCLCEYADTINYQEEANKNGIRNGKVIPKYSYLQKVPANGYYRYKTNPNMLGEWIISGAIRIIKVLSDQEVEKILNENGYKKMERDGGDIDLTSYGF